MPISKMDAVLAQLEAADAAEVREIVGMLDARIQQTGGKDIHVWKQEWASKEPTAAALAAVKEIFEAPGMGWTFSTQEDRDGMIIWLK